jgi:hypothetical protein
MNSEMVAGMLKSTAAQLAEVEHQMKLQGVV